MPSPQDSSMDLHHPANQVDLLPPVPLMYIPLHLDTAKAEENALQLLEAYDPSWQPSKKDGRQGMNVQRLTGGLTNTLIKATKRRPPGTTTTDLDDADSNNDNDAIIIRAYGEGTDVIVDRAREIRVHTLLATRGLAASMLARFDNGFMYAFTPGHVCSHKDLAKPQIYRQVAKRLGQWHRLPIDVLTCTPPPDWEEEELVRGGGGTRARPYPNNWTGLRKWIQALPRNTAEEKTRLREIETEFQWFEPQMSGASFEGRAFVFAHGDLLAGNVVVDDVGDLVVGEEEAAVNFIDYEATVPASAAYDIANHFAEWAGFDCDHTCVPTRSQRREFLHHYVASYRSRVAPDSDAIPEKEPQEAEAAAVEELFAQVDLFRGLAGFYGGVWALMEANSGRFEFDYFGYAEKRMKEYWAWKEERTGRREREGREMYIREKKWASE